MKKTLFAAMALLAVIAAQAQRKFTVSITTHPQAKELVMADMANPATTSRQLKVSGGKASVSAEATEGTLMILMDQENRMAGYFIADAPEIAIDMNTDDATGSPMNERLAATIKQMGKLQTAQEFEQFMQKAIDENKDNVIGAFLLNEAAYGMSYEQLRRIFNECPFLASHPLCQQAKQVMEGLALRAPGTMFKDLEENDTTGQPHKLSEYVGRGNYVLVDFWASWCGPCRQEMPNVVAAYEKYHAKGFNVVGLSFDQSEAAWKKAILDLKMTWTHLSDLKGWKTVAAQTYGINSIPASILVAPDGRIVATDLRGEALMGKLREIYGE